MRFRGSNIQFAGDKGVKDSKGGQTINFSQFNLAIRCGLPSNLNCVLNLFLDIFLVEAAVQCYCVLINTARTPQLCSNIIFLFTQYT